ncbi:MAG: 2-oxoglutarate dehydrogenase complex dihydrolipoyllysine-residue succinyltransferase [Chloroflexi bacterium]|nr:2-oxoglutarate dehydrogenase complex dihydrolipoyllysine-residue succinyltransferase [Chloroflexota bacterium]MBV6437212.1 Dihydrolipoyllysine-residue succinyltransferase component of 2-oxoglutarate dehydrogenase complex [Anaerolineae bacterium]MDL1914908.1 2-oxoglutarate dehydrogenase complex dihydrolipoyllysine-residue succinyltransferase [Anaerolineae bacterium CFX4]MCC6564911.1 2-oxoglutarate dehydrogenase complex dihydrolipoyllysine-residue succinyltransferase [Chloroflexota bacterium]M
MAVNITVPELSESVTEATVAEWMVNVGDSVKAGDVLVTLETDKVAVEVTAESDGVIASIDQPAGSDVKAKQVLGTLDANGTASAPAPAQPVAETKTQSTEAPRKTGPLTVSDRPTATVPVLSTEGTKVTPVAQRVAAAYNVPVEQVPASSGKVTKADVQHYVEQQQQQPKPASEITPAAAPVKVTNTQQVLTLTASTANGRKEERVRLTRRRQTIARRLIEAQSTAAMLTTFNEIDMSAVIDIRTRRKEAFQKKHGIGLGFSSFFVKASIGALKVFPAVNSEIQDRDVIYKHYYDIGIAIGAAEGLVVPVLRDADKMSFAAIEQAIKDYAQQAKDGTLSIESLMGGTFTITNGGIFGSMMSTPILNPPQVGILGLHAIKDRPVVVDGQIVIRPMMYVALTYDHRIIDGREAVQFLVKVKELIEEPEQLLLEG